MSSSRVQSIHTVEQTIHIKLCGVGGRVSWGVTLVGAASSEFAERMRLAKALDEEFQLALSPDQVQVYLKDQIFTIPLQKEET